MSEVQELNSERMTNRVLPSERKPSVCVVSHQAYGAMRNVAGGFIGGVEWQTSFFARWLAEQGYRVTLITWDEGGGPEEIIDGVRVLKVCRSDAGLRGLRFFHPRWTSLNAALHRADADVYYHNCAEAITGQIALWCKKNHRPFVYSVASDADCNPALPQFSGALEKALYRAGLRKATVRIAQTGRQRDTLRDVWSLDSTVIPMPSPEPPPGESYPDAKRVLWVGRVCPVKRPSWLLQIANLLPDWQFDLVGPSYTDPHSETIRREAALLPNLKMHGPISRDRIHDYYRRATLLCCTSEYEGFPNTFLEAWSHGVPVVATVNPDNLLTQRNLGLTGDSVEALADAIKRFGGASQLRSEYSTNAREYFQTTHNARAVLPRFEQVLVSVAHK